MWFTAWLAQTGYSERTGEILLWAAVLILLLLMGVGAALLIKRKVDAWGEEPSGGPAFTLDALRRMHASGQLSDDEFARAKARIIGVSRSIMAEGQGAGEATARSAPEADADAPERTGSGPAADKQEQDREPGGPRDDDGSANADRGPSPGP